MFQHNHNKLHHLPPAMAQLPNTLYYKTLFYYKHLLTCVRVWSR
jgi:hypothetical protein